MCVCVCVFFRKIFSSNGSLVPDETCGHGKSNRTIMAFVESFFFFSFIVRSLPGDLNVLVLFSLH